MPIAYDRLLGEVRTDLGEPDLSAPTDDLILQKAGDVIQLRFNEQQNTGVGWAVRPVPLVTQPNKAVYVIGEGDGAVGKPIRVHTIDPANPYHVTRKVELVDRQNIEQYYYQSATVSRLSGQYHTAEVAVPFWQNGQSCLELIPVPISSVRYQVWVEEGEIAEPTPEGPVPIGTPFWRYFRVSVALACLPHCMWSGLAGKAADNADPERALKLASARQGQLGPGLVKQEAEYRAAWEEYISSAWKAGAGEPNGYAEWAEGW